MLAQAHERGLPFSGVVWRSTAPRADESSADAAARLETEIANLLSAVHTVQGGEVKLPGGLWIVTERAVATESGEPVDPVQAALWGFGRTTINEEPALRCRLVDCDGSPEAVQRTGQPAGHTGRRAGTRTAARKAAGLAVVAVGAQRSSHGAARRRLRPGAHRTRCDRQPAADRDGRAAAGRGLRAGPGRGRGPQLPRRAQRARPLPGRSRPDRRRLRRRRHPIG